MPLPELLEEKLYGKNGAFISVKTFTQRLSALGTDWNDFWNNVSLSLRLPAHEAGINFL